MKNKQQSDKHVVRENVFGRIICTLHYEKQTTTRQTCSARKCVWGE